MAFKHRIDFSCDGCGKQYSLEENMDLPPQWLGVQIAISDNEGTILKHEQEYFSHFCSIECLTDYSKSEELKERMLMSDVHSEEDDMEEDGDFDDEEDEDNGN
jgi:hypothetical protein